MRYLYTRMSIHQLQSLQMLQRDSEKGAIWYRKRHARKTQINAIWNIIICYDCTIGTQRFVEFGGIAHLWPNAWHHVAFVLR